ncbi:hypothetical protein HMPREF0758_2816 [Serratia odorifera DSM 4582]|uniref:Uncharacterized protein n=1 Tax=Serratia odorifera DSM 4582 TaxID=667129 RepID=D4E3R6_SEROD|nr:hypothetical protein HMPREF0758_2816 [Serratia odorifera DSM 4582]
MSLSCLFLFKNKLLFTLKLIGSGNVHLSLYRDKRRSCAGAIVTLITTYIIQANNFGEAAWFNVAKAEPLF